MAKKYICDRCERETIPPEEDDFGEIFESIGFGESQKHSLLKPLLCEKCQKGYDRILSDTNKKIKNYLSEKN